MRQASNITTNTRRKVMTIEKIYEGNLGKYHCVVTYTKGVNVDNQEVVKEANVVIKEKESVVAEVDYTLLEEDYYQVKPRTSIPQELGMLRYPESLFNELELMPLTCF
jgi:hypothetical protein